MASILDKDAAQDACEARASTFRPGSPPHGSLKADELIPLEYLLRVASQRCACGESYRFHELLLVYIHPQWTASTGFRKLVPVTTRSLDLPFGTSFLQEKTTPVCIACLGDLKPSSSRPAVTDAEWAASIKQAACEARAAAAPRKPAEAPKPKFNVMDLKF